MVWNYCKTFEIVTTNAILRKDFQQLQIVKKMVKTQLKVNVIGCPISESNQLASEFQE
jgi:pantothenate synthetase